MKCKGVEDGPSLWLFFVSLAGCDSSTHMILENKTLLTEVL